jgi:hypothetical protein
MPAPVPAKPRTSWVPDRKILAGGVAGVLAWGVSVALRHYGIELDANAQSILVAAIGGLISYVTPPSQQDVLRRLNDGIVQVAMDDPKIPVTRPK